MVWKAYNTKRKVYVKWLGWTGSKSEMEKRLKKYKSPEYVKAKSGRKWNPKK